MAFCAAGGYPDAVYFRDTLPHHDVGGEDSNVWDDSDESDESDDEIATEVFSEPLPLKKPPANETKALPSGVEKVAAKRKLDMGFPGDHNSEAPPILVRRPLLATEVEVNTTSSTQALGSESKDCLKPPYATGDILPTKKARKEDLRFNDRIFWLENFMTIPPDISRAIAAERSVADIGSTLVPVVADVDDSNVKAIWQDLEVSNEKVVHNARTLYKKRDGKWRVTGQIRARNLTIIQAKGLRLHFPQSLHPQRMN